MTGPRPASILRHLAGADAASDRDLLRQFAASRNGEAFAELVRRHGPVVLGVCRLGTGRHEDAEDAFQAVFLILARRAGDIRQPELVGNWLYRVAVGVARNARRAAARRRRHEVQLVDFPDVADSGTALPPDLGPVLDEELDALPALYRDAVVLCDLRGASRADAAAQLGVPLGTLASRLDAGRKKLAARLIRRGVTLSVGAVAAEARAVAVPDELFTRACELVTSWAAGAAVPAAVLRLARGGPVMKTVLLGGVLALTLAAGAALAVGTSVPPATTPPPNPSAAVAVAQPDAAPKPAAAGEQPPAKVGPPRLRRAADLKLRGQAAVAWSRDGAWIAVAGAAPGGRPGNQSSNALVVLSATTPKADPGELPIPAGAEVVGFTHDGKAVLAATRETGLISGEHLLHRMTVGRREPRHEKDFDPPVVLGGDALDPAAVPSAAEQLTVTGPQDVRFLVRGPGRVAVWHADPRFEARWPLGGLDGAFSTVRLTPDGRRVVALAGRGVVEGYDAATGKRLWATEPAVKLPEVKIATRGLTFGEAADLGSGLAVGLSGDGRRAVVARGPLTPVLVLDLDSGKSLPVPADLARVAPAGPVAVSADGRLAALAHAPVVPLDGKLHPQTGTDPQPATHAYGPPALTVWDVAPGAVVQSWEGRVSGLAFHPTRPVLAVLEPHGSGTRLGLWDFTAQP